jgi:hypothetical protein
LIGHSQSHFGNLLLFHTKKKNQNSHPLSSFRPAEDIACAVSKWFANGGNLHNYYMYQGGTNFGRTVTDPFFSQNQLASSHSLTLQ